MNNEVKIQANGEFLKKYIYIYIFFLNLINMINPTQLAYSFFRVIVWWLIYRRGGELERPSKQISTSSSSTEFGEIWV